MPLWLWYPTSLLWEKLRKAYGDRDEEEIKRLEALRADIQRAEQNNVLYAAALFALLLNRKGRDAFITVRPVLLRLITSFNQMTIAFTQAGSKAPMLGISCTIAYTNICRKLGLIDGDTAAMIGSLTLGVNTAESISTILGGLVEKFSSLFNPLYKATATVPSSVIFDIPDEGFPKEIPLELAMQLIPWKAKIEIEKAKAKAKVT